MHRPPRLRTRTRRQDRRPASRPAVERFEPRVLFAIFVVTTTSDDANDPGSLRAAITAANETENQPFEPDIILFDIPGTGVHTITPLSPLPAITDAVIIDATDPANFITPNIELDGSLAGAGADGLVIASTDDVFASFITGFIINSFSGNGVRITGDSNGLGLNYIGTDTTGAAAGPGNGGHGILIESSNNFVSDNVIAFNGGDGIAVVGATATRNDVAINNFFSNGGLAIDLGNDGVTANDPLDPDTGPNTLQNFPVLNSGIL